MSVECICGDYLENVIEMEDHLRHLTTTHPDETDVPGMVPGRYTAEEIAKLRRISVIALKGTARLFSDLVDSLESIDKLVPYEGDEEEDTDV